VIGKLPKAACPGCSSKVKKPYLVGFRTGSVRRLYECPACGKKFAVKSEEGEK